MNKNVKCTMCGGGHSRSACPWPMSARAAGEQAREVGRFVLALVAVAILLGVMGQLDMQDAIVLAGR